MELEMEMGDGSGVGGWVAALSLHRGRMLSTRQSPFANHPVACADASAPRLSGPPTHSKHYRAISFDFLGWHFRLTSSMSFSISRLTLSKT